MKGLHQIKITITITITTQTHSLVRKSSSRYGMEICNEHNKILVNDHNPNKGNSNNMITNMYGKKLEQVKSFKYIGVTLTNNANSKNKIAI